MKWDFFSTQKNDGDRIFKPATDSAFTTRTELRQKFNLPYSGEEVSQALVGLFTQAIIKTGNSPACLDSEKKTAEAIRSMPKQPAAAALPAPVITHTVPSSTLTDHTEFKREFDQYTHAVISYPKIGVENLVDVKAEHEMHTVYFGHDISDYENCMLFDSDIYGGYVKAPCKPLMKYFSSHIRTLYNHKSPQSPTVSVSADIDDVLRPR